MTESRLTASSATASRRVLDALSAARVPFAYVVLAWVFYAGTTDVFHIGLAPGDGALHGLPSKIYNAELSFWNPYVMSGASRLASAGFQTLYLPGILIMKVFTNAFGYNLNLLLHYAFAGYFTFLFVRRIGLGFAASFIAGLCFMCSGFMAAHKGHHTMMNAAVWLPLVLYFLERHITDTRRIRWLMLASIAYAMAFYADYIAIPMYIAMIAIPYVCFRIAQSSPTWGAAVRRIATTVAAFIALGLALSAPYIAPIVESLPLVTRDKIDYAFFSSFSLTPRALPIVMFPYFWGTYGHFYQGGYFGPWNLTEIAGYMGIIPVALAILAFVTGRRRSPAIWFWSAIAVCCFVLVLGRYSPIYPLLYHVPIYNMFRAPARNWFEVHFAVAVLAGYGVELLHQRAAIAQDEAKRVLRRIWVGIAIVAAALVCATLLARRFIEHIDVAKAAWLLPEGAPAKPQVLLASIRQCWKLSSPNIYVPLVIVGLGGLATWACLFWLKRNPHRWMALGGLVFLDLASFGHFHETNYAWAKSIAAMDSNGVYRYLREHSEEMADGRLLPLEPWVPEELSPNFNLPLHVPLVSGYFPSPLKNYVKLLGLETWGVSRLSHDLLVENGVLSMLSTRYISTSDARTKGDIERISCRGWPAEQGPCNPRADNGTGVYVKVLESEQHVGLYRNTKALPKYRFAKGITCVNDFAGAARILRNSQFDPAKLTLVECGDVITSPGTLRSGTVLATESQTADRWVGSVATEGDALLIRGESHYPGWRARVDGRDVPIVTVNGVLQGIVVPGAGPHRVEFVFTPRSFFLGLGVMLAGLLVAFGAALVLKRSPAGAPKPAAPATTNPAGQADR